MVTPRLVTGRGEFLLWWVILDSSWCHLGHGQALVFLRSRSLCGTLNESVWWAERKEVDCREWRMGRPENRACHNHTTNIQRLLSHLPTIFSLQGSNALRFSAQFSASFAWPLCAALAGAWISAWSLSPQVPGTRTQHGRKRSSHGQIPRFLSTFHGLVLIDFVVNSSVS